MIDNSTAYLTAVNAIQKLIAKSKDAKSTSVKSYITALYTADDENPLRFSGKIGMLQIDFDRDWKLHFLRFYDIQSLQLIFQVQLFYGFGDNYRKTQKDTLYIFDLFADGIVGFEFRNKEEAEIFALKVRSVSPKNEQFRELMKRRVQKQITAKKQATFFGKIAKKLKTMIHEEEQTREQSVVVKVEKNKCISLNQMGELDLGNAPPEWEDFICKAGLKKQDLKDKQVMKIVFEQIAIHQAKKQAELNPNLDKKLLDLIKVEQENQAKTQCSSGLSQSSDQYLPPPPPQIHFGNQSLPPPPPIPPLNLPPPPPISALNLPPPQLGKPLPTTNRTTSNRDNLLAEIKNNNLKLRPVKITQKGMEVDLSTMNKQQRHDQAQYVKMKLQMRKKALRRREASDSEND